MNVLVFAILFLQIAWSCIPKHDKVQVLISSRKFPTSNSPLWVNDATNHLDFRFRKHLFQQAS